MSCYGHSIYGKPFEPKFDLDQYLRSYVSLYQALGSQNQIQNCNMDYVNYKDGYCFCGYDFTPDQEADQIRPSRSYCMQSSTPDKNQRFERCHHRLQRLEPRTMINVWLDRHWRCKKRSTSHVRRVGRKTNMRTHRNRNCYNEIPGQNKPTSYTTMSPT